MFCSVKQLALARGVTPQAILDGIAQGRYNAIQIGHDWRIFGVGGTYGKIKRSRACYRRTGKIRFGYDIDRAGLFSASFKKSLAYAAQEGES